MLSYLIPHPQLSLLLSMGLRLTKPQAKSPSPQNCSWSEFWVRRSCLGRNRDETNPTTDEASHSFVTAETPSRCFCNASHSNPKTQTETDRGSETSESEHNGFCQKKQICILLTIHRPVRMVARGVSMEHKNEAAKHSSTQFIFGSETSDSRRHV